MPIAGQIDEKQYNNLLKVSIRKCTICTFVFYEYNNSAIYYVVDMKQTLLLCYVYRFNEFNQCGIWESWMWCIF